MGQDSVSLCGQAPRCLHRGPIQEPMLGCPCHRAGVVNIHESPLSLRRSSYKSKRWRSSMPTRRVPLSIADDARSEHPRSPVAPLCCFSYYCVVALIPPCFSPRDVLTETATNVRPFTAE